MLHLKLCRRDCIDGVVHDPVEVAAVITSHPMPLRDIRDEMLHQHGIALRAVREFTVSSAGGIYPQFVWTERD